VPSSLHAAKACLVICADRKIFELLVGMLLSLRILDRRRYFVGLIDVGLTVRQRAYAATLCDAVVEVNDRLLSPLDPRVAADIAKASPFWRAQACRPYLPEYFPGFRHYVHLDADMWVQRADFLDAAFDLMDAGRVVIVPEVDSTYPHISRLADNQNYFHVKREVTRQIFGDAIAAQVGSLHHFNTGFFGMRHDLPHWDLFKRYLIEAYKPGYHHLSEQITFGIVLLNLGSMTCLPASCNWMCNLAPPVRGPGGEWCSPVFPHEPIRLLHLTGTNKLERYKPIGLLYDEGRYLDGLETPLRHDGSVAP
jgi:hypothetical protein